MAYNSTSSDVYTGEEARNIITTTGPSLANVVQGGSPAYNSTSSDVCTGEEARNIINTTGPSLSNVVEGGHTLVHRVQQS